MAEILHRHVEDVAHLGIAVVVVALEALLVARGQLRDRERVGEVILYRQLVGGVVVFPQVRNYAIIVGRVQGVAADVVEKCGGDVVTLV